MGIIFDNDQIAIKDGTPYVLPRDANFDAMSVIGGFDATNTFRFAKFTDDGKLKVDASISIEHVDIGDVNIQVVNAAGADILVSGGTNPDGTTKFLYAQDQRMGFTGGSLKVNITSSALPTGAATEATQLDILEVLGGGSSIDRISRFDFEDVSPNGVSPTTIVDYEVPAGSKFRIESIRGWGDVDAEFAITIDTVQVDGYRTTPATLTMNIEKPSIQYATEGQHVVIGATHFKSGPARRIKAVLQGALETI